MEVEGGVNGNGKKYNKKGEESKGSIALSESHLGRI